MEPLANRRLQNRDRKGAVGTSPAPTRDPALNRDREAVRSQSLLFNRGDEGAVEIS